MTNKWLALLIITLLMITFSVTAMAEEDSNSSDLLSEDWSDNWTDNLAVVSINDSTSQTNEANKAILDFVSIKIKGDLAYSDELTTARGNLRLLSEGAPIEDSYLKADVQFNYYNAADDLLGDATEGEFTAKINDLWAQYSLDACNVKLGRQGLFWGAVEGTRALDIIAPLDLTEPLLTDFSLIRRSQDILNISCFQNDYDIELFLLPKPLLDQYTARQTAQFKQLEDLLGAEWGGRVTKHSQGLDLSLYYGRFYDNTPKVSIDSTAFMPNGIYVEQFQLVGAGLVYAIDRLLLEMDLSYQKVLSFHSSSVVSNNSYLLNKKLKERLELALGAEYTTASNHQFSAGVWFYEYEESALVSAYQDTIAVNAAWSKRFLNDDLNLSALAFWQKQAALYQATLMADLLLNDYWSTSIALSYQQSKLDELSTGLLVENAANDWTLQLSLLYQF